MNVTSSGATAKSTMKTDVEMRCTEKDVNVVEDGDTLTWYDMFGRGVLMVTV